MNKNEVLNKINSDIYLLQEAAKTLYHGKTYAITSYDRINKFFKTKRGAEGHINKNKDFSYYDDYTQDMVTPNANDEAIEILASELKDIKTDKELWYNYLRENMSSIISYHMGKNIIYTAKDAEVTEDLLQYIETTVKEIEETQSIRVIEDKIIEEVSNNIDVEPEQEQPSEIENCKCAFGYCSEYKEGKECKKCSDIVKSQGFTGCVFATDKENILEVKKIEVKTESQPEQKPETIIKSNSEPVTADNSQQPSKNISEYFTIEKKKHEKKNIDIWVCRLIDKLSKDNFYKLNEEIKALGGYYSKFVKGFVFKEDPTELLNNSNIDTSIFSGVTAGEADLASQQQESQEKVYPEININDIESYTIDKELSKRENDNSMFRMHDRDHQKELQEFFQECNDNILELIKLDCSSYIEYKSKTCLQSFKKKYYELYKRILIHKGNNPSWAVTGRSGLNINRYNKKQDQLMKMEMELGQLIENFNNKIRQFKYEIKKDNAQKLKAEVEQTAKNIGKEGLKQFERIKVKINGDSSAYNDIFNIDNANYVAEVTAHQLKHYSIIKNWGCFRVYDNGKEIYSTKTNENLDAAKKYVLYLLQSEGQETKAI